VQAHKVGSRVIVFSRNGHDFTDRFPSIAQLLRERPAKTAVLDGEVVASDADGRPTSPDCTCVGPGRALSACGRSTCSPSTGRTGARSR
jgi:hypothetical protein